MSLRKVSICLLYLKFIVYKGGPKIRFLVIQCITFYAHFQLPYLKKQVCLTSPQAANQTVLLGKMQGCTNLFLRPFFSDWESFKEFLPELHELFAFKPEIQKAAKAFVGDLRKAQAM